MATQTVQSVPKSTSDSLQKLGSGQEGTAMVAGGDAAQDSASTDSANMLEMAKQTAQRVARSTGDTASKLSSRIDPLMQIQATAKHVAETTSGALQRLEQEQDQRDTECDHERDEGEEMFPHTQDSPLTSTAESALPYSLSPSPTHRVNGFTKIVKWEYASTNSSTPVHLPTVADDTIRILPTLPSLPFMIELPSAIDDKTRMLPPVPEARQTLHGGPESGGSEQIEQQVLSYAGFEETSAKVTRL